MSRLFLLGFLALYTYSHVSFADGVKAASTFIPCPTALNDAKKLFSATKTPDLSDKCYDSILQHISNGEEAWVNNAEFFQDSGAVGFNEGVSVAMTEAIVKNPTLMLQIIYDLGSLDAYKGWCASPFVEATPNEITPFDNAAIAALKSAKIPHHLEGLRQQCIDNFIQDRDHPFSCKLLTPEAVAASVRSDGGKRVSGGDDQCDVMLSYQLNQLKPEWLAILPVLTDKRVEPDFRDYGVRLPIVLALPKSPETVLKILSQYFGEQTLTDVCHPDLVPPDPDPEAGIDMNIKIDPDPYLGTVEYQLDVPKAVQALSQLKLIDPALEGVRAACLKGLQDSLKSLQQKEQAQQ